MATLFGGKQLYGGNNWVIFCQYETCDNHAASWTSQVTQTYRVFHLRFFESLSRRNLLGPKNKKQRWYSEQCVISGTVSDLCRKP